MVISSLNAQMYDQIAKLNERGISACMIQRHRMVSWFTAKEMTGHVAPLIGCAVIGSFEFF